MFEWDPKTLHLFATGAATALVAVTAVLVYVYLRSQRRAQAITTAELQSNNLQQSIELLRQQLADAEHLTKALRNELSTTEKANASGQAELRLLKIKLDEQRIEFDRQKSEFNVQFENMAIRILDQSAQKLEESSNKTLGNLLDPLRQKISSFEQKVSDTYEKEARERFALKSEIEKIILANQRISEDATNLTQALRGDVKKQGNWGELKLERLLDQSGLKQGEEYIREARDLKLKNHEGASVRPDVIVNLPDEKHVIVDAKVSLVSYEKAMNSLDDQERAIAVKDFCKSIKGHVDGLSAKNYDQNEALKSPDFVMMFCPIESAFSLLMEADRDMLTYAWDRRIMLVTPTTLLAGLRTIASLWKSERQNKNALEIARQGGALYDKFAAFITDLDKVGKGLQDSQKHYESALGKLSTGRGNLMSRAERLRDLGAKTAKKIELLDG